MHVRGLPGALVIGLVALGDLVKNTKTGAVCRLSVEVDNQVMIVADLRRLPCGRG